MRIPLNDAANRLNAGGVVAVPTETVYGLAASLEHPEAIAKIFSTKGRPSDNPLIIHLSSAEAIKSYAISIPEKLVELAERFWPGPLTLVLSIKPDSIPSAVRAGLPTAAFRVPKHHQTRELLRKTGPLVMPSANLSGRPSATKAQHVESDFGADFPVLDGGECAEGVESTILIYREGKWEIIRLGAIPAEAFESVLGYIPVESVSKGAKPVCPGQMYRHYSPKCALHLVRSVPVEYEGVIVGFEDRVYPHQAKIFSLGLSTDPYQVAHRLYDVLRSLDIEGVTEAYVDVYVPNEGLWNTILERLKKSACK